MCIFWLLSHHYIVLKHPKEYTLGQFIALNWPMPTYPTKFNKIDNWHNRKNWDVANKVSIKIMQLLRKCLLNTVGHKMLSISCRWAFAMPVFYPCTVGSSIIRTPQENSRKYIISLDICTFNCDKGTFINHVDRISDILTPTLPWVCVVVYPQGPEL